MIYFYIIIIIIYICIYYILILLYTNGISSDTRTLSLSPYFHTTISGFTRLTRCSSIQCALFSSHPPIDRQHEKSSKLASETQKHANDSGKGIRHNYPFRITRQTNPITTINLIGVAGIREFRTLYKYFFVYWSV